MPNYGNSIMKIIWTEFAISELKSIYDYYKWNVGITIAKKIKTQIFASAKQLTKFPESGQIEENLLRLGEFRYLVSGNYKIIYKQVTENIFITDIFDCRQNPKIMKENVTKK
jgi:plasmid stabilization system protein ParE